MHGKSKERFCGVEISCVNLYGNIIMNSPSMAMEYPLIHHDIRQLRDGSWIYNHFIDREFDFSSLGVDEVRNVRGDGLTIIDRDGKVIWSWNCFDHLNPLDDPDILDEDGAFGFMAVTEDWLHANSIVEDSEGDFYVSFNRLKQIWKIDRETGDVVYRLGHNGDVAIPDSGVPLYLHSLSILENGDIMIFENGSAERSYSRVLAYRVNEQEKRAEVVTDITLPEDFFSPFQSSVYRVDGSHLLVHSTNGNQSAIVDNSGKIVWQLQVLTSSFRAEYIREIIL